MAVTSGVRPAAMAARHRLAERLEKLKAQHESGTQAAQLGAALTDVYDGIVLDLCQAALEELDPDGTLAAKIALAPHGGYGRRDMAPYSDVDLMLLHASEAADRVPLLAKRLIADIGDAGVKLGFSVRTVSQACRLTMQDPRIYTSLTEARYLGGSASLFARFMSRFRRLARQKHGAIVAAVEKARWEERAQYGDTVFLLKPNVKRSPGGLRDIQLVRWVGFAGSGESSLTALRRGGALSDHDWRKLRDAREFLMRLRNEMHFHAGKACDVLDRVQQRRIAEKWGCRGDGAVTPAQQLMREYFHHTSEVRHVALNFVAGARPRAMMAEIGETLLSHQVEGDFSVGPRYIRATRRGLEKLQGDLEQVLRLMDLANLYDKWIDHATWDAIRNSMVGRPVGGLNPSTAQRFLSLLSQPPRLADLLRQLHEVRVLEKIVPGMEHARGLVQMNDYHKYTVDEHCLRAVECATEFAGDRGPLGEAYRGVKHKRLLHLALLIHDLGKGHERDHSEVGRELADETAQRLGLADRDAETLRFLVHKHLMMSHLAFRRDLSDESVAVQLAVDAGSPEALQMLYVLTCADLAAVGPGVLNGWKLELITELYHRAMRHVAGEAPDMDERLAERRRELRSQAPDDGHALWWDEQIAALPASYLAKGRHNEILDELARLRDLPKTQAIAWARPLPELEAVEYSVGAYEQIVPGIFHRLTGALSSKGHQILSAEIHSLAGGLILDRFHVQDCEHRGVPPDWRLDEICQALAASLTEAAKPPTFRRKWGEGVGAGSNDRLPTRVRLDNNTSQQHTILDVFAHDCRGLLYAITRALFELGLSVSVAKIGTHLDQVVDVFYVTDQEGQKIEDESRLREIRARLLEAVERQERGESA